MADKICKAVDIGTDGTTAFAPEPGCAEPRPIIIRPDDSGEMWYWTLDPQPADVPPES